jgi:hypothetical protein
VQTFLIVASRNHVLTGVAGGFCQANHGKAAPLRRMKAGDGVVFYSPKMEYGGKQPCQAFTAIGTAADDDVIQVTVSETFEPFRRRVTYLPCIELPIAPLIEHLSFITDKEHWGAPFRFGFLKIPHADYELIADLMVIK